MRDGTFGQELNRLVVPCPVGGRPPHSVASLALLSGGEGFPTSGSSSGPVEVRHPGSLHQGLN